MSTFEGLGLAEPIVRAVSAAGYTVPTPIQAAAIPHVIAGRDVLGCAQTGTGKTAAFALPLLHRLADPARRPAAPGRPHVLVLCPTRELACQIGESFAGYGANLRVRHTCIYGGVSQHHQERALRGGVDVLVATPGRLLDLMEQRVVDLGQVIALVLDEADHMLDMGFIPAVRRILARVPRERQTLLFSATMPPEIRDLAHSMLKDPTHVQAAAAATVADGIRQAVYLVQSARKPELLQRVLRRPDRGRTLVFTRTKRGADRVAKTLRTAGIAAGAIHGNLNQNQRNRALDAFRSQASPVLVATDVVARGIDVDGIALVVNYDLPDVAEAYVHRIGRTARAGASGRALSLCAPDDVDNLRAIERLTRIEPEVLEDEPELAPPTGLRDFARMAPADAGGSGGGRNARGGRSGRGGGGRRGPSGGGRGNREPRGGGGRRGDAAAPAETGGGRERHGGAAAAGGATRGRVPHPVQAARTGLYSSSRRSRGPAFS